MRARAVLLAALMVLLAGGLLAGGLLDGPQGARSYWAGLIEQQPAGRSGSTGAAVPPSSPANGVETLPAQHVLARAKEAAQRAGSVHLVGVVREGNHRVQIDARLQGLRGERGVAHVSSNGSSVTVIKLGTDIYVRGDGTFYQQFAGPEAARHLTGRWLTSSASRSPLAQHARLLNAEKLLDRAVAPAATVVTGATRLVGNTPAIEVKNTTTGSTLLVALTGEPYPLRIEPADTGEGYLHFSDWGQPVTVQAPARRDRNMPVQ